MNSGSPGIRNLTLVLSTIAAIAIAFVGYYYFYVQSQEKQLDQRNQRVLTQIRNNVIRKNHTYVQNAVNNSPRNIDQLEQRVIELVNEDILRQARIPFQSQTNLLSMLGTKSESFLRLDPDSLRQRTLREQIQARKKTFTNEATVIVDVAKEAFFVEESGRSARLSFDSWRERSNRLNQLQYEIIPDSFHTAPEIILERITDTMAAYAPWRVNYNVWVKKEVQRQQQAYRISMSVGMKSFLQPLEREDIFDGILLIREKEGEDAAIRDLIYSSVDDPRIVNYLVRESDRLREFSADDSARLGPLNALPFRIYSAEMVFQDNHLILVGLTARDRFEREKLGISTVAIITMSVIAILILLAFPLMKLVLMGNYERLSLSDLLLAVISAILGTFLLTQLIIDGYGFNGPDKKRRSQQLVELSNGISDALHQELNLVRKHLQTIDGNTSADSLLSDRTQVWTDEEVSPLLWTYPYFQSLYWADHNHELINEWSTAPELAPKIRLSDRSYLTGLEQGKAWTLPDDGDLPPFRLESLVARTTGEQLAVVSIPSIGRVTQTGKQTSAVFATTKLRSLHQPVLPPGFGFAVVDNKGRVWFHSDERRNLQENFLEETDDPSLRAALANRAALRISGSYLGVDHEFFLKPLPGMPLHLVTFRETNIYRSTHAQILSMTFFLIMAAFLTGLGFILVQILVNPRSPLLKNDQFTFDWLRPNKRKRKSYLQLILINGVNFLLAMFLSPKFSHGMPVLCMIGLLYIYAFILAFLKLNKNAHQEFQWEEHKRIVFTTGFLLVVSNIMFLVLLREDYLILFGFQIIPGLFLVREIGGILLPNMVVTHGFWKGYRPSEKQVSRWRQPFYWAIGFVDKRLNAFGHWFERMMYRIMPKDLYNFFHATMAYRIFLLMWLIILSVFPVIRFYEFAYNQESQRLIRFGQIRLLDSWTAHRQTEENFWRSYPQSYLGEENLMVSFDERPLADVGVYTQPFFNTHITPHSKTSRETEAWISDVLTETQKHHQVKNITTERRTRNFSPPAYAVFDSALSLLRPYYTDQARKTHRLPARRRNGDSISWDEFELVPNGKEKHWNKSAKVLKRILRMDQPETAVVVSDLPYYRIPGYNGIFAGSRMLYYTVFIAFILTIYYLVKFVIRKFFAHDFVEQVDPDPLATTEAIATLKRHLYLAIPPRSMVRDYLGLLENKTELESILGDFSRADYVFDLRTEKAWKRLLIATDLLPESELPDDQLAKPGDLPVLILDHLEDKAIDPHNCGTLLRLIGRLLDLGPNLVLVCTQTPVALQEQMKTILGSETAEKPNQQDSIGSDMEAYCSRILGEFTRVDYPLPVWHQLGYESFEQSGPEALPESFATRAPFLKGAEPIARFFFLTSAVLNHESSTMADAQAESNGDRSPTLLHAFGFECIEEDSHQYSLKWVSESGQDFLLDDQTTPDQVRAVVHRIEQARARQSDKAVRIFSTLSPQELIQLLIRDDHVHDEYIQKWDRMIHRFELVEVTRDFRHIQSEERVAEIIREECMYDPFLQGLQSYLRKHLAWLEIRLQEKLDRSQKPGDRRLREAVIIEIEEQAHLYYHALWNNCTEEERYLIYDLAQDGLVNTHNQNGISNLVRKGLVRRGPDSLELMNHSFRNFVLTVVDEEEALKMERKIRREGTWNRIRVPITLILLALGIFIFYFQANWFDDTLGLITALAAAIPALNNVFERVARFQLPALGNLFSFGKGKAS